LLGLVLIPVVYYIWDPHGLRKFPSPSPIAAISPIWRAWHNIQFQHYAAVHQAHQRLGTHVRIAPNHISILDPHAPQQIYGHGANMLKADWYDAAAGPHRNLADTRDKAEHQAKRKMLAHTFSAKTIVAFEPLLQENVQNLLNVLDRHAATGQKANMRRLLNYLLIDVFGQLLYGHELGCLDRGDDILVAESKDDGRTYTAPFIDSLLDVTIINNLLAIFSHVAPTLSLIAQFHPYKKRGTDWDNIIYHHTKKRFETLTPTTTTTTTENNLFQRLLRDTKGQDLNLPFGSILAECSSMMNAGTETITAAMTNTIYLIYTHPPVRKKLRAEILAAAPGPDIPTYPVVSTLPYLRACIEESLRVRPPSSFGLPRVVPKGGREIGGQFIPEDVIVSVPTYSLLRDPSVFKMASEYIPDRWMTQEAEEKKRMMNSHLPFSTGPRACIGRNIAYFEQMVVIATIVRFFDAELEEGFELETQERFNSNPGELPMMMRR
ncbi:cytochrome P450, partial [Aspergillus sclerotioniger CBS 115572]